jgi:hypothetical protein
LTAFIGSHKVERKGTSCGGRIGYTSRVQRVGSGRCWDTPYRNGVSRVKIPRVSVRRSSITVIHDDGGRNRTTGTNGSYRVD